MKLNNFGLFCVMFFCLPALAGCAAGPDFQKPRTAVPSQWQGAQDSTYFQDGAATLSLSFDLTEWWKGFGDPVLDSLIERAVQANQDLKQAESRIRQARAARGVATAGLWPQVDTSFQHTQSLGSSSSITPVNTPNGLAGFSVSSESTTRNLFQLGLDASWELDFFGGTRRNIEAAHADMEAAVEDRRDVLITLLSDVATNYANLRQFQQQIEISKKNLKAQRHTEEITRKRHFAGFVGALDVANAAAQAAATESTIPVLESSARTAIYTLGVLLGKEPTSLDAELSEAKPMLPTPPAIPVGIPSELLRRRPDIRRAESQIHAATARIGVATADLFPKFSLTGNFGTTGNDILSLGNISNRFWSWGPTITWPLFDAGRIRWNIEIQKAVQEQALIAYEKAVLTALKDVETSLTAYAKELQHKRLLTEAMENNSRAQDLAMQLYTAGRTDFLNVLNAQRSLYATEEALARSTNALITDLVALYKALGGGWERLDGGAWSITPRN